jgi:phospholipid/cholesterol/gamma-HCH transport system ATP-binding protein
MEKTKTILNQSLIQLPEKPVLSVRGLSIAFGSNIVLDDFNLDLNKGESIVVLGKSGSGKSVLIKCIIGLLEPDAGEILIFGENVLEMNHEQLDKVRARLGFLFQSNALYDSMTVKENLEFPLRRHWIRIEQQQVDEMLIEALSNVGLAHTMNMMPSELSGGMRKRIALARTLILKPEIILYDEPTTGLDPITGKEISDLMVEIADKYQTSSLIISHDMKCVKRTADRIAVLNKGKCHALGTYEELKKSSDSLVKQFFDT